MKILTPASLKQQEYSEVVVFTNLKLHYQLKHFKLNSENNLVKKLFTCSYGLPGCSQILCNLKILPKYVGNYNQTHECAKGILGFETICLIQQ